jgi:outer membrane protein
MKNPVRSLFALAVLSSAALVAQAQPAPKILVVDMAKLFDSHYRTAEELTKLKGDEQKAQDELDRLNKAGNALVAQFNDFGEQIKNPTLTNEAKQKIQTDAQAKAQEIQRMQNEVQTFQVNTTRTLQQRMNNFKTILIEEISKIASDIAKRKGATLLLDKSGLTVSGVQAVLYSDAALEITDDVLKEINATRPAAPAAAPATSAAPASSATPAPAPSSDLPAIVVPGAAKK